MYEIINGGYFTRHPQSFELNRPSGFEHYVFLCVRSESMLTINDITYPVKPNSYILIAPHTPYYYTNPNGLYMDDWLHFECGKDELSGFPEGIFHHPFSCKNPSVIGNYVEQILWEKNFAPKELRGEHIHFLFSILMDHIRFDYETQSSDKYHPYRFQMQKQRMSMQSAPYLTYQAADMAESLNISLSYYEHLYKEFFGLSFLSDLIGMRIDYAKALLCNTDIPIDRLAYECGYNSEVHFYRQFLAKTGATPGDFRKQFSDR